KIRRGPGGLRPGPGQGLRAEEDRDPANARRDLRRQGGPGRGQEDHGRDRPLRRGPAGRPTFRKDRCFSEEEARVDAVNVATRGAMDLRLRRTGSRLARMRARPRAWSLAPRFGPAARASSFGY